MLRKIKRVSCVNHSVASSIMEMHHSQAIVTIIFFSPLFPRAPPLFLRKKKLVSACCFFIIICACLDENLIIIFFFLPCSFFGHVEVVKVVFSVSGLRLKWFMWGDSWQFAMYWERRWSVWLNKDRLWCYEALDMSVDKILDSSTKPSSLSPFRDKSQTGCRVCAQNFEAFPRLPFALTFQTLYKKEKWGKKANINNDLISNTYSSTQVSLSNIYRII